MTFLFLLFQRRGPLPLIEIFINSPQPTGNQPLPTSTFRFSIFTTNVLINFLPGEIIMTRLLTVFCVALVLFCGINQASAVNVPYDASNIIADAFKFQHGPFHTANADPAPYGITNNTHDAGWIWGDGAYFTVDFGSSQHVDGINIYSTYNGGGRGANWLVEQSDDDITWTTAGEFDFRTDGTGVNEAGEPETAGGGFSGWYSYNLAAGGSGRYLKLSQTGVTQGHAPRVGEITFSSSIPEPSTFVIASLGLLGLISLARRSR